MTTLEETVELLAPEEERVPEHARHARLVNLMQAGLGARFAGRDDVAVHDRLAWFPDRSDTRVRLDPDVMIVFGRPQRDRSSYRSWDEDGVPPTVIMEVRSDRDRGSGYQERLERARRYGAEEVVFIDPDAPGGVTVAHLTVDPAKPTFFRTVAISGETATAVVVARLGISLAAGRSLRSPTSTGSGRRRQRR